ncbi:MAG TPA: prepilin-type N-terminal cleavage/methylation domain-containing protein [Candidatus Acidoferrales bacterium]|nr:prepilin-type N-terminal cleavage/methylation domain-containing protein [Candidatus Acidoferrales bacterium]
MISGQRGSTLIELLVVVGLLALLLAAGGTLLLGMHPGALVGAATDFDSALASARAVASTGGNGATLVFAPRRVPSGAPGFELRVYAGRPSAPAAVTPTTAMPVVSDASVSEATLGAPPFAIFLGASGDVSGKASYPALDARGNATFATIASEPPCPNRGFVLTFTSPQGARATRALGCNAPAASASGMPNPSPTPNAPIVTPSSILYYWPADAERSFVATEWGYAHWFATTSGFSCGNGVATFPNVLPSPYTPAYSPAEAKADPPPPAQTPFSFPNSNGGSTNDAPAQFPLDPHGEGLCRATIADDYGQQASSSVVVMGWLTAAYGGKSATHLTAPLQLPDTALAVKGARVDLALSKTYDAQTLAPQVALDPVCASYVRASTSPGNAPPAPSATPATATVTLIAFALPPSSLPCTATLYDQYPNSQTGEGVNVNATLDAEGPLQAWPPAEQISVAGQSLAAASSGGPCYARAFSDSSFATPLARNAELAADGTTVVAQTDAGGCILDAGSNAIPGGAVARQPGMPATHGFAYQAGSCSSALGFGSWTPSKAGPGSDLLAFSGSQVSAACTLYLQGDAVPAASATPAPVAVEVTGCSQDGGIVAVGQTCDLGRYGPEGLGAFVCADGDGQTDLYDQAEGAFGYSTSAGHLQFVTSQPNVGYVSTVQDGLMYDVTFTRTGPGTVTLYVYEWNLTYVDSPNGAACIPEESVVGRYATAVIQ